jgi:hypothetical protein
MNAANQIQGQARLLCNNGCRCNKPTPRSENWQCLTVCPHFCRLTNFMTRFVELELIRIKRTGKIRLEETTRGGVTLAIIIGAGKCEFLLYYWWRYLAP